MKTLRILAVLTILTLVVQLQAQVTGNIRLADMRNAIISNHSGVKVLFTAVGPPGVTDSTYTDAQGNFSITLVSGTYTLQYLKNGYVTKHYNNFLIPNVPYVRDSEILYQDYPVINYSGRLSGTLQPFTHYISNSTYPIGDTIAAGDTVIVPANCWLDVQSDLVIKGYLKIQGTPTDQAMLFANLGGTLGDDPGQTKLTVQAGGKLSVDYTFAFVDVTSHSGTIEISHTNTTTWNQYGILDSEFINIMRPAISLSLDYSNFSISDCNVALGINAASNFSNINVECNRIYLGDNYINTASSAILTGNLFTGRSSVNATDAGNVTLQDNFFDYQSSFMASNSQPGTTDLHLTNNTFDAYDIGPSGQGISGTTEIYGNIHAYVVNNLGINFIYNGGQHAATFIDFKNNLVQEPWWPDTAILPVGLPLNVRPFCLDTSDMYGNRYIGYTHLFNGPFPNYATADSFCLNIGDPTLLDPDGSRSDIGARRDTVACTNHAIPYPLRTGGTIITTNDSVWPGDANYDGICNSQDVLAVGLKFGATGPLRANASLIWTPQYCALWNDSLANNRNIKHTDCNGDGVINYTDVNAIYQNYSLTHVTHKQQQNFGNGLWLQFPSDSVFEGDTISIAVMLGDNQNPVNNIYGLAFSITYDSAFIKTNSASMKFQPCWLGTDSVNMVSFFKEIPSALRYDVALARTDMQPMSGGGQIGSLIVVINDDILAKVSHTVTTQMDFSDIHAIDQLEHVKNIGSQYGTFNIQVGYVRTPAAIGDISNEPSITIYPNPANDKVMVQVPKTTQGSIALFTLDGRMITQATIVSEQTTVDVSSVPNGLYLMKINTGKLVAYRKIQVAR